MLLSLKKTIARLTTSVVLVGAINSGWAQSIALSAQKLEPINVKLEDVSYKGKKAVRVIPTTNDGEPIAILKDTFENGVIEIDVAGTRLPNADGGARGFIGLAFRVRNTDSIRY